MITNRECRTADYLIYESGAAQAFAAALRTSPRGRTAGFDPAVFLVGLLLTADRYARTHVRLIHRVLTEEVPLTWQRRWGVRQERTTPDGGRTEWVLSEWDLQNVSTAIRKRLNYSEVFLPDQDEPGDRAEERAARETRLLSATSAVIQATLPVRPDGANDYAMDATGIWAADRSRSPRTTAPPDDPAEGAGEDREDALEVGAVIHANAVGGRASDADWGVKTRKDGSNEVFYGYHLHALTRVPETRGRQGPRSEPPLIEAIRLTPASRDVVAPSLDLIDSVLAKGQQISHLLVDRHYSYKAFDRWAIELVRRQIRQVLDLHPNDQGFSDWGGVLIAAGWAHCPYTPPDLGTIPHPGPGSSPQARQAFTSRIAERERYAARLSKPMDETGTTRWECPAECGKAGCPLKPHTVQPAIDLGLPIVPARGTPGDPSLPALCRQRSIGLTPETDAQKRVMKVHQRTYYGSKQWQDHYAKRTYVEGAFGVLKGDSATNKKRGSSLYTGLAHVTLELTIFTALANLRMLRAWHKETGLGDPAHPLLIEASDDDETVTITKAEYDELLDQRRPGAA